MSAFWILSLNSWLQTPAGYEIVNGQFFATDWLAVVFNPSFPYRFAHKLLASALTASFLIAGLCAWQLIKGSATAGTHKAMRTALVTAALVIPIQFVAGDLHGLNTLEHQPAKIAAMEGIWDTEKGAPLTLFGIPDEKAGETHYAIKIPKLGQPDPGARPRRRDQGHQRFPRRAPAGGAGVLGLPRDGGHGLADAGGGLVRRLAAVAQTQADGRRQDPPAQAAAVGAGRHDVLGLGGHALGLVRHRDRPPALHGLRPAAHQRDRHRHRTAHDRAHAHRLPHRLRPAAGHLHRRAQVHGREPVQARTRFPAAMLPWARRESEHDLGRIPPPDLPRRDGPVLAGLRGARRLRPRRRPAAAAGRREARRTR